MADNSNTLAADIINALKRHDNFGGFGTDAEMLERTFSLPWHAHLELSGDKIVVSACPETVQKDGRDYGDKDEDWKRFTFDVDDLFENFDIADVPDKVSMLRALCDKWEAKAASHA